MEGHVFSLTRSIKYAHSKIHDDSKRLGQNKMIEGTEKKIYFWNLL